MWKNSEKIPKEYPQIPNSDHAAEIERAGKQNDAAQWSCYTGAMLDEIEFRRAADAALDALKQHLIAREDEEEAGFEVEEQSGALNLVFEEQGGKFVVTPNTPVRQIWISALATSFKLDWDAAAGTFVLPRTGEALVPLVDRLIEDYMQG